MRIIKIISICILSFLLIIVASLALFTIDGFIEKKKIDKEITSFVQRGEFVFQEDDGSIQRNYFKVVKKEEYEEVGADRFVFDYKDESKFIGSKTDILMTNRNPLPGLFISPFIKFYAENFFMGHAAIVISDGDLPSNKETIEVVGDSKENKVRYWPNDWFYNLYDAPKTVALRLKGTTEEKRDEIVESLLGKPYNFTFLFNTKNSYYCTDLISRPLKDARININEDGFFAVENDFIASDNTYIIYYREEIKSNNKTIQNIYYLSEE